MRTKSLLKSVHAALVEMRTRQVERQLDFYRKSHLPGAEGPRR